MKNHTPRTSLVYRLAREVGRLGSPVSDSELGQDILINSSDNLITTLNRSLGEVRVRDRWNGELFFEGTCDGWTRCAATTKTDMDVDAHVDVGFDDDVPWQRELQQVLKAEKGMEVAA